MMTISKTDIMLIGLALIALALGFFAYQQNQQPRSEFAIKETLQVMAVIRESDCVECVRKVVCYWEQLAEDFNAQDIETPLIFAKESDTFEVQELAFLCQIPHNLQVHNYQKIKGASWLPMATPSIMVTDGNKTLYLEPIFLQTDMGHVHHRIASAINLHLPKASL